MSTAFGPHRSGGGPLISRRALLCGTVAGGLAVAAGTLLPTHAMAATAAAADFMQLSEFLTGRPLDPALGGRYLAAMSKRDPHFQAAAAALQSVIDTSKPADMDALLAMSAMDAPLKQTATTIVSAWYLGIVGADADAELISYANALMYRPTRGALIVPTYGGGPNSWGAKPVVTL